jgi:hypothetical protein
LKTQNGCSPARTLRRIIRPGTRPAERRAATRRRRAPADLFGCLIVLAASAGMLVYRRTGVEPRAWLALCATATPPVACAPRAALNWLQYWYGWGLAALASGLLAFLRPSRPLAVIAACLGAAAVINYNATWGTVGLALAAWGWLFPPCSEGGECEQQRRGIPRE